MIIDTDKLKQDIINHYNHEIGALNYLDYPGTKTFLEEIKNYKKNLQSF